MDKKWIVPRTEAQHLKEALRWAIGEETVLGEAYTAFRRFFVRCLEIVRKKEESDV